MAGCLPRRGRRGRPPRTGQRSRHRVECWLDADELGRLHALARANGYSVADALRLGIAALDASDADDPPVILARWVRDELALLRLRWRLAAVVATPTPTSPAAQVAAIRAILAGE